MSKLGGPKWRDRHFQSETTSFVISILHLLPSGNRGSSLWSSNSAEHHQTQYSAHDRHHQLLSLCPCPSPQEQTIDAWRKPLPTVRQWQDCWCPHPTKTRSLKPYPHEDQCPGKITINLRYPSLIETPAHPYKYRVEGEARKGGPIKKTNTSRERGDRIKKKKSSRKKEEGERILQECSTITIALVFVIAR